MVKHLCVTLCGILILMVLGATTWAIPSYRGYTGLMLIPTADALGRGDFNAGVFFEDVGSGVVNDFVFNYGIIDGLEVGIDRFRRNNDTSAETFLNAKYRFLRETDQQPAIAGGIIDLTDEDETTVYIAASKALSTPLGTYEGEIINPRVHVGLGGGKFSPVFAGVSAYLGSRVEVMLEWDSRETQLGARFRVTPGLTVHAGFFGVFDRGTFGVGVSFGRSY